MRTKASKAAGNTEEKLWIYDFCSGIIDVNTVIINSVVDYFFLLFSAQTQYSLSNKEHDSEG